jgi:tubulin--tyrosine ligase
LFDKLTFGRLSDKGFAIIGFYHFQSGLLPTQYNLSHYLSAHGWTSTRFRWRANFSDENLNFYEPAAQCLEYKHRLAELVSAYCPDAMPLTYPINDQNWRQVLSNLAEQPDLLWILKPALLNNGQHIRLFDNLDGLKRHYLSTNRLGGEHVLQRYITNPHLLRDDRKYSIRLFFIITNYAGAFLYPYGYFNVATRPYNPSNLTDLRPHLTNEHLLGEESNVIQIPAVRFESYTGLYPQMKTILSRLIAGLKQDYPQAFQKGHQRTLGFFGADFMVDIQGRVWLLEVNHGPCFPVADDHPLQDYLYRDFWTSVVQTFILAFATKNHDVSLETSSFERL